ncbi:MAG: acyl dehydratase [Paraglaciecola sp.]
MNSQNKTIVLQQSPNMFLLMLKAALKRTHRNISASQIPKMDDTVLILPKRRLPVDKIRLFNQLVHWQGQSNILHPCILHTLLFPLHLSLFLDKSFPFSLVGLVHIKNDIHQIRPVLASEELDVSCHLADFQAHPKGWMFSVCSQVYSDGDLVWESKSTNLFRLKKSQEIAATPPVINTPPTLEHSESWQLPADLGRKYARSSGDYNLIHLYPLMAKLFGFKRHIAHGMWTKARSLSVLQQRHPHFFEQQFSLDVKFIKAIFLPTKVDFCCSTINSADNSVGFSVYSPNSNTGEKVQHLQGTLR